MVVNPGAMNLQAALPEQHLGAITIDGKEYLLGHSKYRATSGLTKQNIRGFMAHYFPIEMANPESTYRNVGQEDGNGDDGTTIADLKIKIRQAQEGEKLVAALGRGDAAFQAAVSNVNWKHASARIPKDDEERMRAARALVRRRLQELYGKGHPASRKIPDKHQQHAHQVVHSVRSIGQTSYKLQMTRLKNAMRGHPEAR
jgi:hypothetical protein